MVTLLTSVLLHSQVMALALCPVQEMDQSWCPMCLQSALLYGITLSMDNMDYMVALSQMPCTLGTSKFLTYHWSPCPSCNFLWNINYNWLHKFQSGTKLGNMLFPNIMISFCKDYSQYTFHDVDIVIYKQPCYAIKWKFFLVVSMRKLAQLPKDKEKLKKPTKHFRREERFFVD